MTREHFIERYAGIYEHSRWVAERVAKDNWQFTKVDALAAAMRSVVDAAPKAERLALIRAHPDLAGRAQVRGELTADSTDEQSSAGLDQCSPEEHAEFQSLNDQYKARFGFPFIMAVRGSSRAEILNQFRNRASNDADIEFDTAMAQIHKIAELRLHTLHPQGIIKMTDNANQFSSWIPLEQPRLGTRVTWASDEFFAAKERLIDPKEPVFIDGKYDDHGKWMDGWESRRKRTPGHDACIIRLGVPAIIRGLMIDTSFFTGNFPPEASIDCCVSNEDVPESGWRELVGKTTLQGDSQLPIEVNSGDAVTHLRLNIFPDGGIARLRIYGEICVDHTGQRGSIDLASLHNGGRSLACSDEHYGSMHNLNCPGRGINMGDGWETARRRGPGNDWVILALGAVGVIERIEVDTAHFKGNYPDRVEIEAAQFATHAEATNDSDQWQTVLPQTKLGMDQQHYFDEGLIEIGPVSHVRMSIYPDGGVSRLRVFGRLSDEGAE